LFAAVSIATPIGFETVAVPVLRSPPPLPSSLAQEILLPVELAQ
jgi:hypothetical protein